MKRLLYLFTIFFLCFGSFACSVISREVLENSAGPVPIDTLLESPDHYVGQTVILGGIIEHTGVAGDEKLLFIRSAPLTKNYEPEVKTPSKHRFLVTAQDGVSPADDTKGNRITVAGKLVGFSRESTEYCSDPCLELRGIETYVWPKRPQPDLHWRPDAPTDDDWRPDAPYDDDPFTGGRRF